MSNRAFHVMAAGLVLASAPVFAQQAADLPPGAKPGECYARVLAPGASNTQTERVLIRDASQKIQVIPARYEKVRKRVVVREAYEKTEVVPATFKTVRERVIDRPERRKIVKTDAVYESQVERVMISPERTYWKAGTGAVTKVDNGTGEIMCLVTEPAKYQNVTRRVLKTPAGTREIVEPATYRTISKRVIDTPESTRTVKVPAKYKTVTVVEEVRAASTKTVTIPAEYKTITKRSSSAGTLTWQPILCRTNLTTGVVRQLQRALNSRNYAVGSIDGIYGRDTSNAVTRYQRANNMATGGLTVEVLKSLGVRI